METSRVLVTYSDPSGVYPSIAEKLRARLPLRNLNWNSTSRPFRSIPSLHVELLRDAASTKALKEVEGDWAIRSEESKEEDARQGRRHQIPGLRQSPYLKIYFLKCDDVETYRATSRKDVREWISSHRPESQKSSSAGKRDNHDAFEWLIVQISDKLPDRSGTPEASSDNKKEGPSKRFSTLSRMSSRSSSTNVLEKVRSDFNGTSKNAVDRVVQITVEGDKLGFDDLVSKMKTLILASFDLRVAQYEDDIREKEMQRSLPGWNFNTFFVLKEGLARGFEAVGLLEDALTGYHELATGLNAIVEEQGDESGAEQAAAPFNEYTEELREAYTNAMNSRPELADAVPPNSSDLGSTILDTSRKDFRHLILANNISVFDFQCYVFARETALLLRLANAGNKKSQAINGHTASDTIASAALAKPSDDEPENLLVLAETCQLASEFIALAAGRMRKDIGTSAHIFSESNGGHAIASKSLQNCIIENLVASWTNSVSESVLEATTSQTLSTQLRPLLSQLLPSRKFGTDTPQSVSVVSRRHERLPDRTSSLTGASKPKTPVQENFSSISTPDGLRLLPPGTPHPGAQELAAQRGSLFLLARRALDSSAYRINGWQGGLAVMSFKDQHLDLEDVNLNSAVTEDNGTSRSEHRAQFQQLTPQGLQNETLALALHSEHEFFRAFEELTAMALAHYVVGTRTNAAEGMTADFAVVRFNLKDYKSAAPYFDQLATYYGKTNWMHLEITMLDMHAQCLKRLGRVEDFIKVALRAITAQKGRPGVSYHTLCSLTDVITASESLLQPLTASLDDHFSNIQLDPYLRHYSDHDGFQMLLYLRNLLPEPFQADAIRIKIISTEKDRTGEHWLSVDGLQEVAKGQCNFLVGTKEMYPGWYKLAGINIHTKNIIFVHDRLAKSNRSFFSAGRDSGSLSRLDSVEESFLIWARSQHLNIQTCHSEAIDLRRPKSVKVEILSGWNQIQSGKLSIKAASAGLRLDTAEAKALKYSDGNHTVSASIFTKKYQPGTVDFGSLSNNEILTIQIPYSLENDLNEIAVKIQVDYKTGVGEFVCASDCKLDVTLPVSVNVQDIFRKNALFPRFTIGTATSTPLRLLSCRIEGNNDYDAVSPAAIEDPIYIFTRQPYSFVSRIHRKQTSNVQAPQVSKTFQRLLHLQIEYQSLEEEIYAQFEKSLSIALEACSLHDMLQLLKDALKSGVRSTYVASDCETACLLGETSKGAFEEYSWQRILSGLSPNESERLGKALRGWHKDSPTLALEPGLNVSQRHYLTVPFDLPSTHFVHTARLRLHNQDPLSKIGLSGIAIDQPLSMQLEISHTRQWDADLTGDLERDTQDFCYEMQANPDTWLIGGQRRAKFSAKEGQSHTFAVLLVPQTTGRLLYPSVEIMPASKAQGDKDDNVEASPLSCETDYLSQSETIFVVPHLASTTVSLDPANGAWLVESRSRER